MKATVHTKTNDLQKMEDGERSVLRWGGLAGILGSVLMVVTFFVVGVFVGDTSPTAAWVERFSDTCKLGGAPRSGCWHHACGEKDRPAASKRIARRKGRPMSLWEKAAAL